MTGGSKFAYSTNSAHGTDCYRAPELVKRNSKVTMKSDIWALGCVMYELLMGQKRFPYDHDAWEYYSTPSKTLTEPLLPDFLCVASRAFISLLLSHTLARDWWKRPSAAEVLVLLKLAIEGPTQVYLAIGETRNLTVDHPILIEHDSVFWKAAQWEQYWFPTCGALLISFSTNCKTVVSWQETTDKAPTPNALVATKSVK